MSLRLLGGLVLWVTTVYCGPKARKGTGRGLEGAGLYPELGAFGFSEGSSPALSSEVSRLAVLLPSFELTRRELARHGVELNIKSIHRITCQLGAEVLSTRKRDLLAWREGRLPVGKELAGKRVGVGIDGGRLRLRECRRPQKGQGKHKTRRRRYKGRWREPKLLTIFELDEKGRMKRNTRPWIEVTLQGPDAVMELLAYHLHRLGARDAESVTFLCDGAPWIWERLDWVQSRVGLDPSRVQRVLDWCHAVGHVSLAVETLKLSKKERDALFYKLRQQLRNGKVKEVLEELHKQAGAQPKKSLRREIKYLEKHTSHMAYKQLRQAGLPMGSGAVESAIRRVINLRLKGNGIMWLKENAEGMLVLRAAVLSDRWEETLEHVRATMATDRQIGWKWSSPDTSRASKPSTPITKHTSLPLEFQEVLKIPA